MPIVDLEMGLSEEETAIRDATHRFAEEVMRPIGAALDTLPDPAAVVAGDSPLWKAHEKYRQLGLDVLESVVPKPGIDPIQAARTRSIVFEELGWGDAGLAISLTVADFHRMFAEISGRPALIERFCSPNGPKGRHGRESGGWAVTEPDHGSDTLAFTEPSFTDAKLRPNCVARKDGDHYVINGQKSAWVSNGTVADVAALFCTVDPSQGFQGGGIALVPLDLPGVSRGKPLNKLGQRPLNQGEIFFDDVRVPADYLVMGPESYAFAVESVLAMANAAMGTIFTGVARAALEHAIDYAKQRVQGSVPIFQHQSVKARLFKMFMQFEAGRALARRVLVYNAVNPPLVHYSIASKVYCTSAAFEITSGALQIYGGNGLSREYPMEKLLRDARASMIEDGCNDLLSLVGAAKL